MKAIKAVGGISLALGVLLSIGSDFVPDQCKSEGLSCMMYFNVPAILLNLGGVCLIVIGFILLVIYSSSDEMIKKEEEMEKEIEAKTNHKD